MTFGRRPPRLLVKALFVTFGTVAALLVFVFVFVRMSVRDQVKLTVTQNLDVSQRMLAALEARRLRELRTQAQTLAENPTLKAAMDTYAAETSLGDAPAHDQLLATVQRELDKLAARVETDAVALADLDGNTLAASGRLSSGWSHDRADARLLPSAADDEALIEAGGTLFRVVRVPLTLDDGATIGWLDLGNALDQHYAEMLDQVSRARTAIVHDSALVATTLGDAEARDFQALIRHAPASFEPVTLGGSSQVYREIARVGTVQIFALSSVDDAAATALARMNAVLAALALGAFTLALVGSTLLARLLSRPIERLSGAIDEMAAARDLTTPLPATGSSRELDLLASNFNHLMSSVVEAESRTEAAYAAAIRGLAAALDARDPYTAGHSERVSTLSVAIGRVLRLPDAEIEILRLGALLHDIGKIGIPDSVLRKPGPLTDEEFALITQHTVVGARILQTVPFLLPHVDIVELHHERPDGKGYPKGLHGDEIPLLARIVHVADAYDAITSARAYRLGRSSDDALRELWRCAGTEYHAEIVSALARALPRLAPAADADVRPKPDATPDQTRLRLVGSAVVIATLLFSGGNASAQSLSRVSVDSVSAIDLFRGDGTTGDPDMSLDVSSVIRIGRGWTAQIRPWFFKASSTGSQWSRELYQAAVRYERPGRASLRLDAGYIPSPIGLGMLDMRADVNPTIQPHMSYYVPLLRFDRGAPGVGAITASYPLGANVTVSTARWDARAAVVSAAPTRRYAFNNARGNPDTTPFTIVGGGVSPIDGLRLGGSFGTGRYATASEVTDSASLARDLKVWTAEAEYAFRYTKLSTEYTQERFDRSTAAARSSTWFVQGVQTLTPRWFVAGRREAINAPPLATAGAGAPALEFRTSEGAVGYRLTPEITLRASVAGVRSYTAPTTDRRVGVQIVWSRRWW